jgi:plasmid stabilization system protein ParE
MGYEGSFLVACSICSYIAEQSPTAAQRVKARIRAAAEQLGDFPYMARNTDRANVRVRIVNPFPYLIFLYNSE